MTDETLRHMILAFNTRAFPSFAALRRLTDAVVLGYVWSERPTGRAANEGSYKFYFVLDGPFCVGVVLEMGTCDLHWYVLEEHRGRGHLSRALHSCILPHVFSDGRETQTVTVNSKQNAGYVTRQGFKASGETTFIMHRDQVDLTRAPAGQNSPLLDSDIDTLKARLREARAIITSVHEALCCRCGKDVLHLNELAVDIGDYAFRLSDLDEQGNLP